MASFDARFSLTPRTLLALTNQNFHDFQVVVADDLKGTTDSGIEVLCKEFKWPFPIHYVPVEGSMEWDIGIANGIAHRKAVEVSQWHEGRQEYHSDEEWLRSANTDGMIAYMQGEMLLYPDVLRETAMLLHLGIDRFVQSVPSYDDRVEDWQCFDLDSVHIRPQPVSDFGDISFDEGTLTIDENHISPWNCYFAYWADNSYPEGFTSEDKGGFKHEVWKGWKVDTKCLLLQTKVLHQSHFSEISWAHEHPGEDIRQLGDYSEWSWKKSEFYQRWESGETLPENEWRL